MCFYLKKAFVLPNKIPMIVKPKEYKREVINNKKSEELGGYLLNGEYYSNEIIIPNWRSRELSRIEDKNTIYKIQFFFKFLSYNKYNLNAFFEFLSNFCFLISNNKHSLVDSLIYNQW